MTIRTQIPTTTLPGSLPVLNFEHVMLDKKLPFYFLKEEEDLIRLSLVFDAGSIHQEKKGISSAFSKLILSGTSRYNSFQIAEKLDQYGAYVDIDAHYNELHIQLFCMRKYLEKTLHFLIGVFSDIQIPEEELKHHKNKTIEGLRLNLEKTSYLAKRSFYNHLYGNSLYGSSVEISDIENIQLADIENFKRKHFDSGLKAVYSNTILSEAELKPLSQFSRETFSPYVSPEVFPSPDKRVNIQKNDAVQASIFMGFDTINRQHPDYARFNLLNTAFGGYFGSRLMKNIREEKGYTYGINSGIQHLPERGNFIIRTDVKNEVKEGTINEIFKEIDRLKEIPVGSEELEVVKNYMLGSLQRSFDGSLSLTDRFKTLNEYGLSLDYYHTYMETIKITKAEDLQEMANKYWKPDAFYIVIAGNFD